MRIRNIAEIVTANFLTVGIFVFVSTFISLETRHITTRSGTMTSHMLKIKL
jgi:hypothetical protein